MRVLPVLPVFLASASFLLGSGHSPVPRLISVGPVAPNLIALYVQEGEVQRNRLIPYVAEEGDEIVEVRSRWTIREEDGILVQREVIRDGERIGYLNGTQTDAIVLLDEYFGDPLDVTVASAAETYSIQSDSDPAYRDPVGVVAVHRKAKPNQFARHENTLGVIHTIYLELPEPLKDGQTYRISYPDLGLRTDFVLYAHDSSSQRSESIHMNQVGFAPGDPVKRAYVSLWMGEAGGLMFEETLRFHVVDVISGIRVFSGEAPVFWPADKPEQLYREANYVGADLYRLDFPGVTRPGRYVVQVQGVGCSYPFEIREDIWEEVASLCIRGIYHQRSGIALGPPYTDFWRPRPHHPDDGVVVFQSNATLLETHMGMMGSSRNGFRALIDEATSEVVPDAWGGMMDAGDWDRRIQHLIVTQWLLEAYQLSPEYCEHLDLNIPESGNDLPDVIDEALWILDFFVRIQREDGGGRGGIEAAEHPAAGDVSWTEMLPVYAYAPDYWSTHYLVATAAQAAWVLRDLDPERAEIYRDSALRGMVWAENEYALALAERKAHARRDDARAVRNLAAVQLYRLTEDERWRAVFDEDSLLLKGREAVGKVAQRDAFFVYQGLPQGLGLEEWKNLAREALISDADRSVEYSQNNAFSLVAVSRSRPLFIGFLAAPVDGHHLVRGHYLTGRLEYLEPLYAGSQFGLGANPDNNVYLTGIGSQRLNWVLHEDSLKTGRLAPPGIIVEGPLDGHGDYTANTDWFLRSIDDFKINDGRMEPEFLRWPVFESYLDMWNMLSQNEYTPWQNMATPAYVWTYLAAREYSAGSD